jgi:membrane-associated phospholipid phosphatase
MIRRTSLEILKVFIAPCYGGKKCREAVPHGSSEPVVNDEPPPAQDDPTAMTEARPPAPRPTHAASPARPDGSACGSRRGEGLDSDENGRHGGVLKLFLKMFAVQDGIMIGYMLLVWGFVWHVGPAPAAASCARQIYVCISVMLLSCFVARAPTDLSVGVRSFVYRLGVAGTLLYNYLMLRDVLPVVRPGSVDGMLFQLDLDLFGIEPSLYLERFNQRPIVEWFSFFYFSYYGLCLFYLIVVVWISRLGRQTAEFALGTLIVFCLGELGYMAVPGYGPVKYLASHFNGPIDGGFFWGCVWGTVQAGSALKDIFPSLHTAVPLWFTLFALQQAKRDRRWRPVGLITAFFSTNIIVSTMYLRWHYAVDVIAGIVLAVVAGSLAPRLAAREGEWRRRWGVSEVWSFLD